jgi:hypothetical protein
MVSNVLLVHQRLSTHLKQIFLPLHLHNFAQIS